jgi:hypothetical protein
MLANAHVAPIAEEVRRADAEAARGLAAGGPAGAGV